METTRPVPEPTLRRLPLYHRLLKVVQGKGQEHISCPSIGDQLKLDPTQVRKDLQATGVTGRPKVGFVVDELVENIEQFLGWNNTKEAFLVGAGNLGAALLGYMKFEQYGMSIAAAFDVDPAKVGRSLRGKQVMPLHKLPAMARRLRVHIGIITVPAAAAQQVADLMVEGGILAIWNFAPQRLRLPEHIIVHNEDLYGSLASLSQRLEGVLQEQARTGQGSAA
jgi:redox-sensing transcriptional repressor